jgi:hypothetical protein
VSGRLIAHKLGQNKRKQQRPDKCPEVEKCQLAPLSKTEQPGAMCCSAAPSFDASMSPVVKKHRLLFPGVCRINV